MITKAMVWTKQASFSILRLRRGDLIGITKLMCIFECLLASDLILLDSITLHMYT